MGAGSGAAADRVTQAFACQAQGRLDEAEALLRSAVADDPTSLRGHHVLGRLLMRRGRFAEAEAAFRRVLDLAPGAPSTRLALAHLLLSQGRYDEGFAYFEARFEIAPEKAKPALPFPEWRGEDVAGRKLLIWIEQGYGDQIQFARFAPRLKALGAHVTLVCLSPLHRLFAENLDVRVIAASGRIDFPDPDFWTMPCSLAGRLGIGLDQLSGAPYLRAPPGPRRDLPPGLKVGLMTRGNPAHGNDANRSLPPEQAERLRAARATVVDLDPASTGAADFADTAALIDQLDLVVSVDTSVAHLAGAMGKPCWVLLPELDCDWRWLRDRRDSPWYDSARLYRQTPRCDWGEVIDRVLADVAALA